MRLTPLTDGSFYFCVPLSAILVRNAEAGKIQMAAGCPMKIPQQAQPEKLTLIQL